jgi:uncharacterized protein YjeT (DUF2065 family)
VDIWTMLFTALGVAVFLEGLPYFVAPGAVRGYMQVVMRLSDGSLRLVGLGLMGAGLLLSYLTLHN